MKRHSGHAGFTLLELIVTFTILSLVLVMILGAMRLGSASWERGEAKAERYQRRRIVLDLLSQQMRSAYPYKVKAKRAEGDYLAFEGTDESLRFVSTFSLRSKRPEGLVFVMYRVEEGKMGFKGLQVCEKRLLNRDITEESPKEEEFLPLLEDLRDIKFEYLQEVENEDEGEGEWVESWDGREKTALPRQVKVVAHWEQEKEEKEITPPIVITLPAYRYDQRVVSRGRATPRGVQPR